MADNVSLSGRDKHKGKGVDPSQPTTPQTPRPMHQATGGYFPFQQSYFGQPPHAFPNMPFHDGNYFPMHNHSGSFMNMLSSPNMPPQNHSPHMSGLQLSPTSGYDSTPESGSKRDVIEVGEATSPNPKKKRKNTSTKQNACEAGGSQVRGHLKWDSRYDNELIPFLAEMVRKGFKPDKSFKRTAYREAAKHINNKFKTIFTWENVMNRIRTLRTRFHHMEYCRNLSGAGWDDSTKTVIMDPECLERWIEDKDFRKSNLRQYVNRPLEHYDDLALIIGNDQARGDFASDINKKFSRSESINLGDDFDSPLPTSQSPQVHCLDEEDTPLPKEAPASSTSKAKSSVPKGKARKTNADNDFLEKLVDKIDVFSASMKCVNMHWTEKLSTVLYTHLDCFSIDQLDLYYRILYRDENEARLFMGISSVSQKAMINDFLNKEG